MKDINFIKNIDNLGRIVIPMDIRRKLQINTGDILSISCNDKNILLTKYNNLESNFKIIEMLKYFIECFNIKLILVNKEKVIYSNFIKVGECLDKNTADLIKNATTLKGKELSCIFGDNKVTGIFNIIPIITNGGIEGSIIVFDNDIEKAYNIGQLLSRLIQLEFNIS